MVYIIVVSHGHEKYILKLLSCLDLNSSHYKVIIRDNKDSQELRQICELTNSVEYISGGKYGFGRNNNVAVSHVIDNYYVAEDDYFLFLNPDVIIEHATLISYIDYVKRRGYSFSTLCLFRDNQKQIHDYSIRHFPKFRDFCSSFTRQINKTLLKKESIKDDLEIDWCAGSFMCINVSSFMKVNGFDESYFMYCEDVDLCYRLKLADINLFYIPCFNAVHDAHHDNRNIFSKAFRWHFKSALRFCLRRLFLTKRNYKKINSVIRNRYL